MTTELQNLDVDPLRLIPITLEMASELIRHETHELERHGLRPAMGWPTADTMDILPILHETLRQAGSSSGFETWLIVKKENGSIIGDIGFHGKPNELGEVEIGYALVAQERGKGFGYQALQAIVAWALSQPNVEFLKAECLIDNKASARILAKSGMREEKRENGYIYWVLRKADQALYSFII